MEGHLSISENGKTVMGIYNTDYAIDVTIPEGVTAISHNAFEKCSQLRSIKIPSSVSFIGCEAFKGCTCEMDVCTP